MSHIFSLEKSADQMTLDFIHPVAITHFTIFTKELWDRISP